jgi:hypothetical protein
MKPKTHIAIVLDRSSSMASQRQKAVEGYNEHVQQIKIDSEDQDITCSLITFNGNVIEHLWKKPADELEEATVESFAPSGSTAFYDAIGYTIDKFMAEDDGDENTAYMMIVISDGEENASSHYKAPYPDDRKIIREIFEGAQALERWTFNFMLCSEDDVRRVAQATGIDESNMAVWSNKDGRNTQRAMDANVMHMSDYLRDRKRGIKAKSAGFHSELVGSAMNYDSCAGDTSQVDADIAQFKRTSTPLNGFPPTVSPSARLNDAVSISHTAEAAPIFAVTSSNQVLSKGQDYVRPEWSCSAK